MFARIARHIIDANRAVSRVQSRAAARHLGRTNGWRDFRGKTIPSLLSHGLRVLDVGGGKAPQIDATTKDAWSLHVTGLDISAAEIERAPSGSYDAVRIGDVARCELGGPYDLILSTTVLEHVADNESAIANMTRALKPGGAMTHFMPCRYAPFAIANRLLGNARARQILFAVFPEKRSYGGFEAHYDHCTPSQMRRLCESNRLEKVDVETYFASEYLSFCAPLYTVDLVRQLALQSLRFRNLCETMSIVAFKPIADPSAPARAA